MAYRRKRRSAQVGNSDAFHKRGTSLALLKRGEGLDWSIVDLDGQMYSEEEKGVACPEKETNSDNLQLNRIKSNSDQVG